MNYDFLIPVWGKSYVRNFTEISLPTQLSAGNLGAFVDDPGAVYKIMTSSLDAPQIKSSASFKELERMIRTEFVLIDSFIGNSDYNIFSKCHELGIDARSNSIEDTVFFFGVSDAAWSDGSFRRAKEIIEGGKRAVMVSGGFHVVQETFGPALLATFGTHGSQCLVCPARPLLDLAFQHVQIITKSMVWKNGQIRNKQCAVHHWESGENCLMSRCWVFHPMAVRPRKSHRLIDINGNPTTVDNVGVQQAGLTQEDLYVVTDSDEILLLEMSPASYTQSNHTNYDVVVDGEYTPDFVVAWLETSTHGLYVDDMVRNVQNYYAWFHSKELSDHEKRKTEKDSDKVITQITMLYRKRNSQTKPQKTLKVFAKKTIIFAMRPIGKLLFRLVLRAFGLFKKLFPEECRELGSMIDKRIELAVLAGLRKHGFSILSEMYYPKDDSQDVTRLDTKWSE